MHEDPHHTHETDIHTHHVGRHGAGGYFTGATAWMLAMVLFVVLALVVIIALFASL